MLMDISSYSWCKWWSVLSQLDHDFNSCNAPVTHTGDNTTNCVASSMGLVKQDSKYRYVAYRVWSRIPYLSIVDLDFGEGPVSNVELKGWGPMDQLPMLS